MTASGSHCGDSLCAACNTQPGPIVDSMMFRDETRRHRANSTIFCKWEDLYNQGVFSREEALAGMIDELHQALDQTREELKDTLRRTPFVVGPAGALNFRMYQTQNIQTK